jgi:hypothetical protein
MTARVTAFAAALAVGLGAPLHAQRNAAPQPAASCLRQPAAQAAGTADHQPGPSERAYDVVVSVPNLCVDRVQLGVKNLTAHLALDARVSNLVEISAGADAHVSRVTLGIYGVQAQALLLVDLDDVYQVVDRTMTFIDNNPQIVSSLTRTLDTTVGTVGGVANTALQPGGVVSQAVGTVGRTLNDVTAPGGVLSQTVNTLGQTVQRTVGTTGQIVERTLSATGQVLNTRTLGSVLSLPAVREAAGTAGGVVRTVRDQAGRLIEVTLDAAGHVTATRVLDAAGAAVPQP